jgi:hypothetical protein
MPWFAPTALLTFTWTNHTYHYLARGQRNQVIGERTSGGDRELG